VLKLYDYYRSSACYRVRIALNLKGLEYETIPIHLVNNNGEQFSEDYQKINPQSLVPTLQDENKILTQSLAIIEYLEEQNPLPPLLPKNVYHKALARSFAITIATDVHPLNNLRVLKYLSNELSISEEKRNAWYKHWIHKGFMSLEKQLSSHQLTGDFCFGNEPSIADIYLIPQLYNAKRYNCNLIDYPHLVRIDEHCQKNPAFIKARPEESNS
jgi:maleylacetoacetate isomerase